MHRSRCEIFRNVLTSVLEDFALVLADPDDGERAHVEQVDCLLGTIAYDGPDAGTVSLIAPRLLFREIAANVLGIAAGGLDLEWEEDVLKELLNVVCGCLTNQLYGETRHNLGLASVVKAGPRDFEALWAHPESVRLSVEGRSLVARLATRSDSAERDTRTRS